MLEKRVRMHKREEELEDGRRIIYYTFTEEEVKETDAPAEDSSFEDTDTPDNQVETRHP
ncbi:MAG: hypothetical protein KIT45_12320 [Fimbriimonadia bacterium]|nr:hypothetical protein [Fimbriimonadia bacterium]